MNAAGRASRSKRPQRPQRPQRRTGGPSKPAWGRRGRPVARADGGHERASAGGPRRAALPSGRRSGPRIWSAELSYGLLGPYIHICAGRGLPPERSRKLPPSPPNAGARRPWRLKVGGGSRPNDDDQKPKMVKSWSNKSGGSRLCERRSEALGPIAPHPSPLFDHFRLIMVKL